MEDFLEILHYSIIHGEGWYIRLSVALLLFSFLLLLSAKHVFVSNNTVFGERQAPS